MQAEAATIPSDGSTVDQIATSLQPSVSDAFGLLAR